MPRTFEARWWVLPWYAWGRRLLRGVCHLGIGTCCGYNSMKRELEISQYHQVGWCKEFAAMILVARWAYVCAATHRE